MGRRQFLELGAASLAVGVISSACRSTAPGAGLTAPAALPLDAAAYRAERRYAEIAIGKIAYVERGAGDAVVFLHGAPLNGYQWRGAIDRLAAHRRCIAPDFMGLGYTEVPEGQSLAASAQVAMISALLDKLGIGRVDLVASDSGGAVAQLFTVANPGRVRTLLLANCDVEPDSPPPKVMPIIELARAGKLADTLDPWVADKPLARRQFGAAVYRDAASLTDEAIDYYWTPLLGSPRRRAQYDGYHAALLPNPLAGIEPALKRLTVPTRIVWGTSDDIFSSASPDYLDHTLGGSRGVRRIPGAKLFFPEEYPEVIAEEALRLWSSAS